MFFFTSTAVFLTSTLKFNLMPNWCASKNGPDQSLTSSKIVDAVANVKTAIQWIRHTSRLSTGESNDAVLNVATRDTCGGNPCVKGGIVTQHPPTDTRSKTPDARGVNSATELVCEATHRKRTNLARIYHDGCFTQNALYVVVRCSRTADAAFKLDAGVQYIVSPCSQTCIRHIARTHQFDECLLCLRVHHMVLGHTL